MAKTLILIRHGSAEGNAEKRYLGVRSDPGLDDDGRHQAGALAERLSAFQFSRLIASPMSRAVETAEAIQQATSVPVEADERLMEIDFGRWDGKTFAEINAAEPDQVDVWAQSPSTFQFPEGEAVQNFISRVQGVAETIVAYRESCVCVVTHGGVLRGMLCHCLGLPFEHQHAFAVPPTTIACLDVQHVPGRLITLEPVAE